MKTENFLFHYQTSYTKINVKWVVFELSLYSVYVSFLCLGTCIVCYAVMTHKRNNESFV